MKHGLLLVNLGTPDSPSPKDVKKYLTEFLTDGRVIDIPKIQRNLLVRGLIVPRRYKESAKLYQSIWSKSGSPLLANSQKLSQEVQAMLGDDFHVKLAMRYQIPSIDQGLYSLKSCDKITILPLFPQFASATTGSVFQKVFECMSKWQTHPELRMISSFYDHPAFIQSHVERASEYDLKDYDHVLFSYHGLPQRQVKKSDMSGSCLQKKNCCQSNLKCYASQCLQTTLAITQKLKLKKNNWSLSFQSRLGKSPWLKPYSDVVLKNLAKDGKKRVLVFSPAFVADCLETLEEIKVEYNEIFKEAGGEGIDLVASLNDHPTWVRAIKEIIQ